jgi:2EXR family
VQAINSKAKCNADDIRRSSCPNFDSASFRNHGTCTSLKHLPLQRILPISQLPAEIHRNIWRYCVSPQIIDIWVREECFVRYYQSSNQTDDRNVIFENLKADGPWIQKLTTCSQQRIPLHWICGESRLWTEQNSLYLSLSVYHDKVCKEDGEFQHDVLRKAPRRVILDPENDVLFLRCPGLSHQDIRVIREEEEKKNERSLVRKKGRSSVQKKLTMMNVRSRLMIPK